MCTVQLQEIYKVTKKANVGRGASAPILLELSNNIHAKNYEILSRLYGNEIEPNNIFILNQKKITSNCGDNRKHI